MSIIADGTATKRLETFFDYLGEFGGFITTNDSMFWSLDLRVLETSSTSKSVQIGIAAALYEEICYDPQFTLCLTMYHGKIESVEIKDYISDTYHVLITIDDHDVAHCYNMLFNPPIYFEEQDPFGKAARFSSFMETLTFGPYLTAPREVVRYPRPYATPPLSISPNVSSH